MIQLILALLLGFGVVPQPGGFDVLIQFRLTEPPREGELCVAPLDLGFETVLQTTSSGNINVRALPTTKSERVGSVADGSVVNFNPPVWGEAVSGSDVWYPLRDEQDSFKGYVAGALIEPPAFTWGC